MVSSTRRRRRAVRTLVAGVGASLLLTGCGFDAQTLQPYTPANGVNVDLPAGQDGRQLKIRNLLLVADGAGKGVVSASIVSPVADSLVKVEGAARKADNSVGSPLTVTGGPVQLQPNRMVVLTEGEGFTVSGSDLEPGLTADLVLTFKSGVQAEAIAPVMSSESKIYASITPAPAPTRATPTPAGTASPTPAPSATPTP